MLRYESRKMHNIKHIAVTLRNNPLHIVTKCYALLRLYIYVSDNYNDRNVTKGYVTQE